MIHTALTGTDLTNATLGGHWAKWYLDTVYDTVVGSAQINQSSFIYPISQLTVDGVSANWADVAAGQTILVGTTPGGSEIGVYRVRARGNSTTLYIGETAAGDPGLITYSVRTAAFSNNLYVTVCDREDMWSAAPRIIMPDGTIYEDWDLPTGNENYAPGPMPNIYVSWPNSNWSNWSGWVDSGQTYATITFSVDAHLFPTSSSLSSINWIAPLAWGLPTGGSTTGSTVTYRVPGRAANYTIQCVVADDLASQRSGYRKVWVRNTTYQPIQVTVLNSLSSDRSGAKATITLNDNGLVALPKTGDQVYLWGTPLFNDAPIASAWSAISGWVVAQSEQTEVGVKQVVLEIEGPIGLLSKLSSFSQYMEACGDSIPSTWQQLKTVLSFADQMAFWEAAVRATNQTTKFNWTFSGYTSTYQWLPTWNLAANSNLYTAIQAIGANIRCNVGCNPDGEMIVRQHPSLVAYGLRSSIVNRCTLTPSIYSTATLERDVKPKTKRVRGEAFTWDGVQTLPTPLLSDAPGSAPGQGPNVSTLPSQLVQNQSELNQVTGDQYALENNPYGDGTIEISGLWGLLLYAAEMTFVRLQIPASLRPDATALDMNVIIKSISIRQNEDLTFNTTLQVEGETTGVPGIFVYVPDQATTPDTYNTAPVVVPPDPTWGNPSYFVPSQFFVLEGSGNADRIGIDGTIVTVTDISPTAVQITAFGGGIIAVADPWAYETIFASFNNGIAKLVDFWTCDPAPLANWTDLLYTLILHGDSTSASMGRVLHSSINRQGYFCWLEYMNGSPTLGRYGLFCYTTDYFYTVSRVYLGFNTGEFHNINNMYPSCFNTLARGLIFALGFTLDNGSGARPIYLLESYDWGASWARSSVYLFDWGDTSNPGLLGPSYNNDVGKLDKLDEQVFVTESGPTPIIFDAYTNSSPESGSGGPTADDPQSLNVFTLNNKRRYIVQGETGAWLLRADDGFTFSLIKSVGTGFHGVNGWPTNPNFLVIFGRSGIDISSDGGENFRGLSGISARTVFANLGEVYHTTIHPSGL